MSDPAKSFSYSMCRKLGGHFVLNLIAEVIIKISPNCQLTVGYFDIVVMTRPPFLLGEVGDISGNKVGM